MGDIMEVREKPTLKLRKSEMGKPKLDWPIWKMQVFTTAALETGHTPCWERMKRVFICSFFCFLPSSSEEQSEYQLSIYCAPCTLPGTGDIQSCLPSQRLLQRSGNSPKRKESPATQHLYTQIRKTSRWEHFLNLLRSTTKSQSTARTLTSFIPPCGK